MLNRQQFSRGHLLNQISNTDRSKLEDIATQLKSARNTKLDIRHTQQEASDRQARIERLENERIALEEAAIERALVVLGEGYRR